MRAFFLLINFGIFYGLIQLYDSPHYHNLLLVCLFLILLGASNYIDGWIAGKKPQQ